MRALHLLKASVLSGANDQARMKLAARDPQWVRHLNISVTILLSGATEDKRSDGRKRMALCQMMRARLFDVGVESRDDVLVLVLYDATLEFQSVGQFAAIEREIFLHKRESLGLFVLCERGREPLDLPGNEITHPWVSKPQRAGWEDFSLLSGFCLYCRKIGNDQNRN